MSEAQWLRQLEEENRKLKRLDRGLADDDLRLLLPQPRPDAMRPVPVSAAPVPVSSVLLEALSWPKPDAPPADVLPISTSPRGSSRRRARTPAGPARSVPPCSSLWPSRPRFRGKTPKQVNGLRRRAGPIQNIERYCSG